MSGDRWSYMSDEQLIERCMRHEVHTSPTTNEQRSVPTFPSANELALRYQALKSRLEAVLVIVAPFRNPLTGVKGEGWTFEELNRGYKVIPPVDDQAQDKFYSEAEKSERITRRQADEILAKLDKPPFPPK